jgi:hypothetical protein
MVKKSWPKQIAARGRDIWKRDRDSCSWTARHVLARKILHFNTLRTTKSARMYELAGDGGRSKPKPPAWLNASPRVFHNLVTDKSWPSLFRPGWSAVYQPQTGPRNHRSFTKVDQRPVLSSRDFFIVEWRDREKVVKGSIPSMVLFGVDRNDPFRARGKTAASGKHSLALRNLVPIRSP